MVVEEVSGTEKTPNIFHWENRKDAYRAFQECTVSTNFRIEGVKSKSVSKILF